LAKLHRGVGCGRRGASSEWPTYMGRGSPGKEKGNKKLRNQSNAKETSTLGQGDTRTSKKAGVFLVREGKQKTKSSVIKRGGAKGKESG